MARETDLQGVMIAIASMEARQDSLEQRVARAEAHATERHGDLTERLEERHDALVERLDERQETLRMFIREAVDDALRPAKLKVDQIEADANRVRALAKAAMWLIPVLITGLEIASKWLVPALVMLLIS